MYLIEDLATLEPVAVGIQGESNVTVLEFDVSAWVTLYGAGSVAITYQNSRGKVINLPSGEITRTGNIVSLSITQNVTYYDGTGNLVLHFSGTGIEKHSVPVFVIVAEGHSSEGVMPDAIAEWIADANAKLAEIDELAGYLDVEQAVIDANTATGLANAAAQAATEALALIEDRLLAIEELLEI